MQRIEYKIREVNRKWLEDILFQHGAEKFFEGEIVDIYYDRKTDGFMEKGKRLSLRTKGDSHKLSFKDKYNELGLGIIDEWEVEISDGKMMDQIMLGLGFQHFKIFKKFRYDYVKDDVFISFDKFEGEYEYIPEFMMIEASQEAHIFEWAERFGYKQEDCEPLSVMDLIAYYKKKRDSEV
ncbi:CYTH domain-containing protein [Candidatus Nomurabacteria bacterium]|uniref:CYTH domain-containing protein n=1 Tax=Candidatus Dojkabacteria bacterium TaxID=2099670 RepID=A0A955I9Q4_9BACT|nr:CYTH domain-containing protein [Candidatus Dojkabacteria bacterium]MCB9789560.1 CYTH domain-containing protein [Candidatus Nomurabacteria bacterium]MCB9803965.1 CYTH domain-containing protein [Candidatus Nomurabacteria bacterium]